MMNKPDNRVGAVRVVAFTGGPTLRPGILRFLGLLEDRRDIELVAVFCQSPGDSAREIVRDAFRRRGMLALPVLAGSAAGAMLEALLHPSRRRELADLRNRLHDRTFLVPDIHDAAVVQAVRDTEPEVGVVYGAPILKPDLFTIPQLGTLGIHHGTLPGYRGKKTTFWELYNGEAFAGVTIQRINAGLDTGEIIRSGKVAIRNRSLGAVWKELEPLGWKLYVEAILETAQAGPRKEAMADTTVYGSGRLYRDPSFLDLVTFFRRRVLRRVLSRGIRNERGGGA